MSTNRGGSTSPFTQPLYHQQKQQQKSGSSSSSAASLKRNGEQWPWPTKAPDPAESIHLRSPVSLCSYVVPQRTGQPLGGGEGSGNDEENRRKHGTYYEEGNNNQQQENVSLLQ